MSDGVWETGHIQVEVRCHCAGGVMGELEGTKRLGKGVEWLLKLLTNGKKSERGGEGVEGLVEFHAEGEVSEG